MVKLRAALCLAALLATVAVAAAQTPPPSSAAAVQTSSRGTAGHATPEQKAQAKRLATALVYGTLLLLIFVMTSWALLRFSRHYRTYLIRGKRVPTPSDDVWAMHRPPPEEMWPDDDPDPEHPQ